MIWHFMKYTQDIYDTTFCQIYPNFKSTFFQLIQQNGPKKIQKIVSEPKPKFKSKKPIILSEHVCGGGIGAKDREKNPGKLRISGK